MTRLENRQKERELEKKRKQKILEEQGFEIIREEYKDKTKRNISNRKSKFNTVKEEQEDKQNLVEETLKVYRKLFPTLVRKFGKIKDPRNPKKVKHKTTVLMIYGIFMFVFQTTSLRNANKNLSSATLVENMKTMFPEFDTIPHSDTLKRFLEVIEVSLIEEVMIDLLEQLIKNKKFRNNLIKNRYHIVIDGTQKFCRDTKWDEKCLKRCVGKEKTEQYYVYVVEAVIVFNNGMTLPFMTEFLENEVDEKVQENIIEKKETEEKKKQDHERKGFYRMAKKIKKRFPKLKISIAMDGLYANGPVIRKCREYSWDYMLVYKDGNMTTVWSEVNALIKLNPENSSKKQYCDRKQYYYWANEIEYTFGKNNRLKEIINVVICEEKWNEIDKRTGEIKEQYTKYAWLSGKEITKENVVDRCMKLGRYRWKIENNFLVLKHQGYLFEHCFSYNWNIMKGFHYLMKIGRLINVLVQYTEFAIERIKEIGIKEFLKQIYENCKILLDVKRLKYIATELTYQWRLDINQLI